MIKEITQKVEKNLKIDDNHFGVKVFLRSFSLTPLRGQSLNGFKSK